MERARQYVEQGPLTYRHSVQHNRCQIGYPIPVQTVSSQPATERSSQDTLDDGGVEASQADQPVVDHGLIWRFLTWLGGLSGVLDEARAMLLRTRSDSICHRLDGNVDPHKARSPERLATLETARQLLQVIPEWEDCFGCQFFPRFATRAGFD